MESVLLIGRKGPSDDEPFPALVKEEALPNLLS